jgi:hypothetical protein
MRMRPAAANRLRAVTEYTFHVHSRQLLVGAIVVALGLGAAGVDGKAAPARALCKFSRANGNGPPGVPSTGLVGNGRLATSAYGVIDATPRTLQADGSVSEKFWWWGARVPKQPLRIGGQRLDGAAPPLRARVNEGGVDGVPPGTRFWSAGITFPTAGCWQVVGRVGKVRLALVVKVRKPAA